ncbi:hypothetical protein XENORESO_009655 [Xenotaenia resolanae]|uniref:Uncharacterized protein n=1 Tax=Xenotaenia resolanae TaxID=208358 RepID=A0ABV0VYC2_9TELE
MPSTTPEQKVAVLCEQGVHLQTLLPESAEEEQHTKKTREDRQVGEGGKTFKTTFPLSSSKTCFINRVTAVQGHTPIISRSVWSHSPQLPSLRKSVPEKGVVCQ